jgi:Asp-tRNA(Asn)/Glu-tRNA(Gln) amidotransferase A subunit family amidase
MIRGGQVSCREAVAAALARLDAINPRINAVVRPLHE